MRITHNADQSSKRVMLNLLKSRKFPMSSCKIQKQAIITLDEMIGILHT